MGKWCASSPLVARCGGACDAFWFKIERLFVECKGWLMTATTDRREVEVHSLALLLPPTLPHRRVRSTSPRNGAWLLPRWDHTGADIFYLGVLPEAMLDVQAA